MKVILTVMTLVAACECSQGQSNSLSELAVTRQDFAVALRSRGWVYDDAKHLWRKGTPQKEESLFTVRP